MFVRSTLLATVLFCAPVSNTLTGDALPSTQEVLLIEAHASSWDLVIKREQLRLMTDRWRGLISRPDSAAAYYGTMLPVANNLVDQLSVATGYSRGMLMRWVESDAGLKPYFFPPRPEQRLESKGNALWRILSPLVPIILYRVVDRVMD